MKAVREIMSTEVTCGLPSSTVKEIARQMKISDIGVIPIVNNYTGKKLMGLITDRDLVLRVLCGCRDKETTKARAVMTKAPVTCFPNDTVDELIIKMKNHGIRRVPVVDARYQLVGIVSEADIALRVKEPLKTTNLIKSIRHRKAAAENLSGIRKKVHSSPCR